MAIISTIKEWRKLQENNTNENLLYSDKVSSIYGNDFIQIAKINFNNGKDSFFISVDPREFNTSFTDRKFFTEINKDLYNYLRTQLTFVNDYHIGLN